MDITTLTGRNQATSRPSTRTAAEASEMGQETALAQRCAASLVEGGGETSALRPVLSVWPDSAAAQTDSAEAVGEASPSNNIAIAGVDKKAHSWGWLTLLRPILGSLLLVAAFFVMQATSAVPGLSPQTTYAAWGNTKDYWGGTSGPSVTNTRTVTWVAYITGNWLTCGGSSSHWASYNGGGTWFNVGNNSCPATPYWQTIGTFTAGSDGYANAVLGNALRFESCSASTRTGCNTVATGSMDNNLFMDTQAPSAAGHLNATCFSPGQTVQMIDGGSSDPAPSSGWGTNIGMWYYQTSWGGGDSGWVNPNSWSWTVPTPSSGAQSWYWAGEYIRDAAANQSGLANYGFYVDNSSPNGGWISAGSTYTNATTTNLSFNANAGGCAGIDNVAISNNQANWWYANSHATSYGGWDFTNPSYGGNNSQGWHTIYIAFHEAGSQASWDYTSTSIFYDTQTPTPSGYINSSCFSPGGTVYVYQSGSSDPDPSSGWNWGGGAYYFYNNWTSGSGWTNSNPWGFAVPTPAVGSQGSYQAELAIRDNVSNYTWAGFGYSVDNTSPNGGWISAGSTYTNATTTNLSFDANAGGCAGIDNVAISNNQANWWYANYHATSYGGWDFTNPSYGGNNSQGWHTIYIAFHEAGSQAGWFYTSTTIFYDSQPPPTTISTSSACLSSGDQATITVGRTDPAPSSGWLTSGNASTSWWNGTEDPWSGPWRNDPWPGNTNSSATYNVGVPTPAAGTQATYTRVVWTRDNAQNNSDQVYSQGRNVGVGVTVDNTSPSGAWASTSPTYTNITTTNLSFGASAGGCKGINNVAISNDNVNWWYSNSNITSLSSWDFTGAAYSGAYGGNSSQGWHTIYISFHEGVSQTGTNWTNTHATVSVFYDTVGPTGSININGGAAAYTNTQSVTLGLSASDAGAGVSSMHFSADGTNWGSSVGYATSYPYTLTSGDGTKTVYVQYQDAVGNWSSNYSSSITLDTAPPVWHGFTAPVGDKGTFGGWDRTSSYTFAWNAATDAASGLSATPYPGWMESSPLAGGVCGTTPDQSTNIGTLSAPSYAATGLASGRCYRVAIQAVDKAGNNAPGLGGWYYSAWVGVDFTPPTVSWNSIPNFVNASALNGFSVSWVSSDSGSGVASATVQRQEATPASEGSCVGLSWSNDGATYPVLIAQGSSLVQSGLPLSPGMCYRWTVYATDAAGNPSSAVTSTPTFLDTSLPTVDGFCETGNGLDCTNPANAVTLPATSCMVIAHDSAAGVFGSGLSRVWCGSTKPVLSLPAPTDPGWVSVGSGSDIPQWVSPQIPVITTPPPLDGKTLYIIAVDQAGNNNLDLSNPGSTMTSIGVEVVDDCTLPAPWTGHTSNNVAVNGVASVVWAVGKPLCLIPYSTDPAFHWARIANGQVETGTITQLQYTVTPPADPPGGPYSDCYVSGCGPYDNLALRLDLLKETPTKIPITTVVSVTSGTISWKKANGDLDGTTQISGYTFSVTVSITASNTGQTK